jgi:predicted 2-oxoglutarate/Fe(II)-dependent dioxygenase YbiX/peroxiredoxin
MKPIKPQFGVAVPRFEGRTSQNANYHFDTVAGRYIVLSFLGSARELPSQRVLSDVLAARGGVFNDQRAAFFAVSIDPVDESSRRLRDVLPGVHVLWDFDRKISRLFGAMAPDGDTTSAEAYRPFSLVLDARLRVVAIVPLAQPVERHVPQLLDALAALPPLDTAPSFAPVLEIPRVFEPEVCQALMRYYEQLGGGDSGFMLDVDGKTVGVYDHNHKRRRDQEINDAGLQKACMVRIHDRVVPELEKAFQFHATRIERYIVACYDAETGGHFRAHRDNTTRGTAHRRFAVSLVLNTGEFEGGQLRFPEFGAQRYSPPAGGAIVFSCSLLHELSPVTRGRRYAFLPFLYDEAAAKIRRENEQYLTHRKG